MTDPNQRYFLNLEAVSTHLYCSICQDVFNDPQRAPCGHSFCKQCIHQWLKQSKTCPEDRKPVTVKQLHYDFILANIIGDQMVACPFRMKGCEYIDKLERISSHKKTCSFNPTNLPAFMKGHDTSVTSISENDENYDDADKLPTPAKPSLRMRLFCDERKREALRSLLEVNGKSTVTSSSADNSSGWLSKDNIGGKKRRPDLLSLDDSF